MTQFFTSPFPLLRLLLLCPALVLTACGGGGGSGGGSNGGQQPDPTVVDIPVAYIQRPLPLDKDGAPVYPDVFMPDSFNPGGELYLKVRATTQAEVANISRCAFEPSDACSTDSDFIQNTDYDPQNPNYDVKDVSVSPDGKKLVFALHEPDRNFNNDEGPTWNIWQYDLETKKLSRAINSELKREEGHDVSPRYLRDGRILFSSTRQTRSKAILANEARPPFAAVTTQQPNSIAFNLHSMWFNSVEIQQLTYNQSHDIQPSIMRDGRVLFMRWKENQLSFYTSNSDGTDIQRYFGDKTLNQALPDNLTEKPRLLRPQVMPDGRIAAIYLQNRLQLGGDMVVIDGRTSNENEIGAKLESISVKPVDISTDRVPLSGRFASLSPLYDGTNRLLVSWSQCRLQEEATGRLQPCLPALLTDVVAGKSGILIDGYKEAPPFYGLWIYNITDQTQLPVVLAEEGKVFTEAITLAPRSVDDRASEIDPVLAQEDVGVLDIRSVYDFDGDFVNLEDMINLPPDQRPARFVRITKAVSEMDSDLNDDVDPDEKLYLRVIGDNEDLKEILGYAPIEPDGSVKVRVPADVAFSLEILDANGRQISNEHTTLLQLRPGETMVCNGCHEPNSSNPHGRRDLEAPPISTPNLNAAIATLSVDLDQPSSYDNLPYPTPDDIATPATSFCRVSGDSLCRIVINYEYHIQPLWELERADPMEVDDAELGMTVIANTCVGCHSTTDPQGNMQVPKGKLELTRDKSDAVPRMRSYMQLLNENQRLAFWYNDTAVRLIPACEYEDLNPDEFIPQCEVLLDQDGVPTCEGVVNCPFVIANLETGELELDPVTGNPVPESVETRFLSPVLTGVRANQNRNFFDKFENNDSHMGFLNAAELKLLSEWLDTGGRYYTNPFELAIPN